MAYLIQVLILDSGFLHSVVTANAPSCVLFESRILANTSLMGPI